MPMTNAQYKLQYKHKVYSPIFHSFDCLSSFVILVVLSHVIKHLRKVLL